MSANVNLKMAPQISDDCQFSIHFQYVVAGWVWGGAGEWIVPQCFSKFQYKLDRVNSKGQRLEHMNVSESCDNFPTHFKII